MIRKEQLSQKFSKKQNNMMYGIAATMMGHLSVAPAVQDGLYTPERHLFYLAMQTFIYQYRKSIGMLNAYAEPFYPPTEENQHMEEIKKEDSDRSNEIENNIDPKNDKTSQNNNALCTKEDIIIQETNEIIEEDWVQVKRNIRMRVVREAIQVAYITNAKNRYAAMKEEEVVVEDKDNEKKLPVYKKTEAKKRTTYNVNDITINEMIQHIKEYKEKDDIANAIQKKTKEKKNTNTYYKTSNIHSSETQEEKDDNIIEDSASESDDEINEDDSSIDENDLMLDDDDSDESFNIEDLNEEEKLYVKRLKDAVESTIDRKKTESSKMVDIRDDVGVKTVEQMESIRYQNNLLLFRLEQAEDKEERLLKELKAMEEASLENIKKIAVLESALKKKTELILNTLRNKG